MNRTRKLPGMSRHHHKWKVRHSISPVVQNVFGKTCFVELFDQADQWEAWEASRPWSATANASPPAQHRHAGRRGVLHRLRDGIR
jgi:hypothetical protein